MDRLKSFDDLYLLRDSLVAERDPNMPVIVIPAGTCGQTSGANDLIRIAKREILTKNLVDTVGLRVTGCHGFCEMEPSVLIEPFGTFYPKVGIADMVRIVEATARGEVVEDLLFVDAETGVRAEKQDEVPFFSGQLRLLLSQSEKVDPIRIADYIENGGYSALARVLAGGNPGQIVSELKASGLRGRGGAGFLTGAKWEMLAAQRSDAGKYLICNADEGDPGAYMDRSLLEGNPHSIIEGMVIGAFATGATEGVIYVRGEYPLAIRNLGVALGQARDLGLLGENILGTGLSFDIRMVKGAGAFVCGEETALIKSIEGKAGEPRQRPPFPVQKGVEGKPTAINNVETWANIPLVFRLGAEEFAKIGTKGNSGTKIFSLVGKIRNTGLVEVPMGTTIESIVYDIGGGPSGKASIKAVQTGGPSGGCIPAERFDLRIDYDTLAAAGSIMGSGGMIVMDENTCMVDVAKYFMNFLKGESCGKCLTCRKGIQCMHEILEDISAGRATMEDLDLLEELALVVKDTTMCGLGQTSANPVLSTLRHYRNEYERHIIQKKCDAFVCKDLVGAPCQSACPVGTQVWRYVAHLRRGEYDDAYRVIRQVNPFPSVCGRVCHHPCEDRCRAGASGQEPVSIRALKRFATENVGADAIRPQEHPDAGPNAPRVAVVGAGPAGLTAASELASQGCKVTIFEAEAEPGGLLVAAIPEFRLPRNVVRREIESLIHGNITLECNKALGRDITIDGLLEQGFDAVFVAVGAHKDRRLNLEGEDVEGVYPALEFLKTFNLHGKSLAKGRVGIIGGGNCAVDAARIAVRQEGVSSVTIIYRRTRNEMPAFEEEIDAAIEEGVILEQLVSPLKIHAQEIGKRAPLEEEVDAAVEEGVSIEALATPVKIHSSDGRLTGLECIRNELGEVDSGGRRRPVPIPGTEFVIPLDTLIVAIGEETDAECVSCEGVEVSGWGAIKADPETNLTGRPGVFAGGDAMRGPNTVIDAIADGRRAAAAIMRYLKGLDLAPTYEVKLPVDYVEPVAKAMDAELDEIPRAHPNVIPIEERIRSFKEVEETLSVEAATCEAGRCLRCDLEFTAPCNKKAGSPAQGGSR